MTNWQCLDFFKIWKIWKFQFFEKLKFPDFEIFQILKKYFVFLCVQFFFSDFFSRSKKNISFRSWDIFFGITSMQKIEIFRFMRFSERFRYSFIGFGVVSFYFHSFFTMFSLLSLAASGGIQGDSRGNVKSCPHFFGKMTKSRTTIFFKYWSDWPLVFFVAKLHVGSSLENYTELKKSILSVRKRAW